MHGRVGVHMETETHAHRQGGEGSERDRDAQDTKIKREKIKCYQQPTTGARAEAVSEPGGSMVS